MHDVVTPHCSYCEHFKFCFRTDLVTEWGYCCLKVGEEGSLQQEIVRIKREVESGSFETLLDRAEALGLFVPMTTTCASYSDVYPI